MEAYAVIETGGKQYRVQEGNVLNVELVDAEAGQEITFDNVLAISDGKKLSVGTPNVSGAKVSAEVLEHFRGPKLVVFKRKRRKGYKKKLGHRQELTKVRIVGVGSGSGKTPEKAEKEKAEVKNGS